ncbi:hypothetical protein HPP92_015524 [Vanilla planifolia]|uniref:Secreted protein n=1 Tax=Vanilla planifolia TaxID=51239 RepID=A0A835UR89_VANPL|nr:hypothetical protein HPP92_015524 [Vanilla planifolia]
MLRSSLHLLASHSDSFLACLSVLCCQTGCKRTSSFTRTWMRSGLDALVVIIDDWDQKNEISASEKRPLARFFVESLIWSCFCGAWRCLNGNRFYAHSSLIRSPVFVARVRCCCESSILLLIFHLYEVNYLDRLVPLNCDFRSVKRVVVTMSNR